MKSLVVNEVFHSIQGESSYAGKPCVFVRLTYCNLRCGYCDTAYAFHEGVEMRLDEILEKVKSYACPLVEITGGEPLFQPAVHDLMSLLCDEGYETLLETGGSLDIGMVDQRVRRIVDFKCPGSGMMKSNLWSNAEKLTEKDEVKFVIGSREDFDWSVEIIRLHEIDRRCPVIMSVVFDILEPRSLAEWILDAGLDVRMQLQMHKFIWEPETRGV